MWATCNVGAETPEDEGLLFQFGSVDGYEYLNNHHEFRTKDQNEQDTGNKHTPQTTSGKVYDKNDILEPEDDAAHVHMGGKWRMPTYDELVEFYENTKDTIETINGIKGRMFTSNINGNCIFIPFAGYWYGSFSDQNNSAVWSSQVDQSDVDSAYLLECHSDFDSNIIDGVRFCANSVRGVFKK